MPHAQGFSTLTRVTPLFTRGLDSTAIIIDTRQWPEVYDLCHTSLYVVRVKKPTAMRDRVGQQSANRRFLAGPSNSGWNSDFCLRVWPGNSQVDCFLSE